MMSVDPFGQRMQDLLNGNLLSIPGFAQNTLVQIVLSQFQSLGKGDYFERDAVPTIFSFQLHLQITKDVKLEPTKLC